MHRHACAHMHGRTRTRTHTYVRTYVRTHTPTVSSYQGNSCLTAIFISSTSGCDQVSCSPPSRGISRLRARLVQKGSQHSRHSHATLACIYPVRAGSELQHLAEEAELLALLLRQLLLTPTADHVRRKPCRPQLLDSCLCVCARVQMLQCPKKGTMLVSRLQDHAGTHTDAGTHMDAGAHTDAGTHRAASAWFFARRTWSAPASPEPSSWLSVFVCVCVV
jgi:hypothetical protein